MLNLTVEKDVVELMEPSKSESEWNKNCDKVKSANGDYPPFWYQAIVLSGLLGEVSARWGGDDKIHIINL